MEDDQTKTPENDGKNRIIKRRIYLIYDNGTRALMLNNFECFVQFLTNKNKKIGKNENLYNRQSFLTIELRKQ